MRVEKQADMNLLLDEQKQIVNAYLVLRFVNNLNKSLIFYIVGSS